MLQLVSADLDTAKIDLIAKLNQWSAEAVRTVVHEIIKKFKITPPGQYRLRVGVYRVRYDVIKTDVVLYRVRHRKDIYR